MSDPSSLHGNKRVPFLLTLVWFAVVAGASVWLMSQGGDARWLGIGLIAMLALVVPVSVLVAWHAGHTSTESLEGRVRELTVAVNNMVREGGLSEGAKRVIHRKEERELLRRAIEQDIQDGDWDAATVLVKELADRFGYRSDAEEFRTRIERVRAQTTDRKVVEALQQLDDLIRGRRWAEAYAEAARIHRLYPESHRVEGLRERVDAARAAYRKDLERRFLMAAEKDDAEHAMGLLKELDQYLTPSEAEPYQEVARGVIGKLRENLGVRFKLQVQDMNFPDAIETGQKIIAQFPNTRMAQEVREILPVLRERAAKLAAVR
ncbi:MAG: hypothetical protein IBJ11_05035 [Phycisphaerales bacterium]|nr:hypothetical protein [Phycisphaerales bacterium]